MIECLIPGILEDDTLLQGVYRIRRMRTIQQPVAAQGGNNSRIIGERRCCDTTEKLHNCAS
jgi:acetyl-CoA carboxylase alpha subunit